MRRQTKITVSVLAVAGFGLLSGCAPEQSLQLTATPICTQLGTVTNKKEPPVKVFQERDGVISFVSDLDILYDGSARAYSAVDPGEMRQRPDTGKWGGPYSKCTIGSAGECAPESICSGVSLVIPKPGGKEDVITNCKILLDQFNWFRSQNWPAKNASGHWLDYYAFGMRESLTTTNRREPCILKDGWIVSINALPRRSPQIPPCSPDHWIDALVVNGIVASPKLLNLASPRATKGDLAVVRYNGRLVGGLVSEANNGKAGEASASLAAELRQRPLPKNLLETYNLAISTQNVEYFVFPGTYSNVKHLITNKKADADTLARFAVDLARAKGITGDSARHACGYAKPASDSGLRSVFPAQGVIEAPSAASADPDGAPFDTDQVETRDAQRDPFETDRENADRRVD